MLHAADDEDPLRMRLLMRAQHERQAESLIPTVKPLLAGLDPDLTYIRVMTPSRMADEIPGSKMAAIETVIRTSCPGNNNNRQRPLSSNNDDDDVTSGSDKGRGSSSSSGVVRTPALSVMLFLRETGTAVSAGGALRQLQNPPWSFHHKIELSNARSGHLKVIGRQEFYRCTVGDGGTGVSSGRLPLWAVCPVHCGAEHLRLTVFTRHFPAMVDFYRLLVGHEAEFTRPNFCLFTVSGNNKGDVQLALKCSKQLQPEPLTSAFLTFRVPSLRQLEGLIHTPNGTAGTLGRVGDNLWLLRDPDSNCVLVEEVVGESRISPGHLPSPYVTSVRTETTKSPDSEMSLRSGISVRSTICPRSDVGPKLGKTPMPVITPRSEKCIMPESPSKSSTRSLLGPRLETSPRSVMTPRLGTTIRSRMSSTQYPINLKHHVPSPETCVYSPKAGGLRRWVSTSPNKMESPSQARPPLIPITGVPGWTDHSSWDSGWHSGRSDPETAESVSASDDLETCSSASGVLLCECDVTTEGRCVLCDVRMTSPPVRVGKPQEVKAGQSRRRAWEVDDMDLSWKELNDLLSMSASNEVSNGGYTPAIDVALNNLNLNQLT